MTREEIIKGLYRGYNCTEKDECFESGCKGCIEVLFTEYEQQIRAEAKVLQAHGLRKGVPYQVARIYHTDRCWE